MMKACSKCGRIHPYNYECPSRRVYNGGDERKLRSQYSWTKKSEEIRERANHLCEVCRKNGIYTYDNIEVHHIVKVRDDKSLLLDNENLICLCHEHHIKADNGEISQDYLRDLARQRESSSCGAEND